MYIIAFSESAVEDLTWFGKRDQTTILVRIDDQLLHQPGIESRNRKRLRPNQASEWELRIGDFRVFYDVVESETRVDVKVIGRKEHNRLLVRGQEFRL